VLLIQNSVTTFHYSRPSEVKYQASSTQLITKPVTTLIQLPAVSKGTARPLKHPFRRPQGLCFSFAHQRNSRLHNLKALRSLCCVVLHYGQPQTPELHLLNALLNMKTAVVMQTLGGIKTRVSMATTFSHLKLPFEAKPHQVFWKPLLNSAIIFHKRCKTFWSAVRLPASHKDSVLWNQLSSPSSITLTILPSVVL
jgi:hypothetical protein